MVDKNEMIENDDSRAYCPKTRCALAVGEGCWLRREELSTSRVARTPADSRLPAQSANKSVSGDQSSNGGTGLVAAINRSRPHVKA